MVQEMAPAPAPSEPLNLLEGQQQFSSLLGQFFVIPMLIAVTAVAIFVGVKMMTAEDKDPVLMVNEVRLQHGSARWQVAYDLNSRLVRDPKSRENPRLVPAVMQACKELEPSSDPDDVKTRTYLVTVLGTLRSPAGMAVVEPAMRDRDGSTQVAAIQAAGAIGEKLVLPDLVAFAKSDDAGVRKAAVFALGLFNPRRRAADKLEPLSETEGKDALGAIYGAHQSSIADLKWNAALALSRWGQAEAAATLKTMLDRAYLEGVAKAEATSMTPEMVDEVMVNAMKGVLELNDVSFRPALEDLRKTDRSMEVRQAAGTVLDGLGK